MIPIKGRVTGLKETVSAISQIPSLLQQAGIASMTECLALLSKTVRDDFLQGPYPDEIERRSGSFRATFGRGNPKNIFRVEARGSIITGTYGSEDIRARVLNDGSDYLPGGVIRLITSWRLPGDQEQLYQDGWWGGEGEISRPATRLAQYVCAPDSWAEGESRRV